MVTFFYGYQEEQPKEAPHPEVQDYLNSKVKKEAFRKVNEL